MGALRYSINVTVDGCGDHRAGMPNEAVHRNALESIERADAMLLGRVTYELMEGAWRLPAEPAGSPEPFAVAIDAARKYVVSSTLSRVDWNAELLPSADLGTAVRELKDASPNGVVTGGLTLPLALAELGLIDEYEFVVHPRIAGHGPWVFAGLSRYVDLTPTGREEFGDGVVAMRYVPAGTP